MSGVPPDGLVGWLKAAGEPTRLRLLTLCAEGAMSVSDLAATLRQSEPRISRHLRILSDAGLVTRQRQGQWVQYELGSEEGTRPFVMGVLCQSDPRDATLARDRITARSVRQAGEVASGTRLGRALAAFCRDTAVSVDGPVCVLGARHPELLQSATALGTATVAFAGTRRATQALRAWVQRAELPCRVREARATVTASELVRAGAPFAGVVLDATGGDGRDLTDSLAGLREALRPQARAWIFAGYESLEGQRVVEHPLARLRRLLQDAGLACERLSPLEADGEHVLAAVARRAATTPQAERGVA